MEVPPPYAPSPEQLVPQASLPAWWLTPADQVNEKGEGSQLRGGGPGAWRGQERDSVAQVE